MIARPEDFAPPLYAERRALYMAVGAAPDEDTLRLALADWLDEHGAGDRDTATAEFIRLSVGGAARSADRIPKRAADWLDRNWHRLLPGLAPLLDRPPVRLGRWLHCRPAVPVYVPNMKGAMDWSCPVKLECWRGFVRAAVFDVPQELELCLAHLAADQPFVEPDVAGALRPHPFDAGTSLVRRSDLGEAWWYLPARLLRDRGHGPNPDQIAVRNDPKGFKAAKLRRHAFRAFARALAVQGGAL